MLKFAEALTVRLRSAEIFVDGTGGDRKHEISRGVAIDDFASGFRGKKFLPKFC